MTLNKKLALLSLPLLIAICSLLCGMDLTAQTAFVDSLKIELEASQIDTHRIILLNDIAWELKFDDPNQARILLDSAANLAEKADFKRGHGDALNYRGVLETIHSNSDEAVGFYQKALAIREALGDRKGVASLYNNIANVQEEQGDFTEALTNYLNSLRIREELGDTLRMARVYYNAGTLYETMGNYPEALDHIFTALELAEKLDDQHIMANAFNGIGNIKYELERWEEAEDYYLRALQLRRDLEDDWGEASTLNNLGNLVSDKKGKDFEAALNYYQQALDIRTGLEDESGTSELFNNMGVVHKDLGNLDTAIFYFNKAFEIRTKLDDRKGIMEVYNGFGDVRRRQEKYDEALDYTEKYLEIAEEIEDKKFIQKAYKDFSKVYRLKYDYKNAFKFRKKYDEMRYERLDEKRVTENERREVMYSDYKKGIELEKRKQENELLDAELRQAQLLRNSLIGGVVGVLLMALLLFNRNRIITKERQRSDELLLNILPSETAEELKIHGKAKARRYDSVTVLFTDFKSFTQVAEAMPPEELVAELDECFRAFDEITTRYGIEKIKTIGDSYMCVGGLPSPTKTHPADTVNAALEMRNFMKQHTAERLENGLPVFEMRMGIHTGPVVAGIVGSKKFAYDIWGDTVNMAARMESSGAPGRVNISGTTFNLVEDSFECLARGKVQAKNKGEVDMYFVEKHREPKLVLENT